MKIFINGDEIDLKTKEVILSRWEDSPSSYVMVKYKENDEMVEEIYLCRNHKTIKYRGYSISTKYATHEFNDCSLVTRSWRRIYE